MWKSCDLQSLYSGPSIMPGSKYTLRYSSWRWDQCFQAPLSSFLPCGERRLRKLHDLEDLGSRVLDWPGSKHTPTCSSWWQVSVLQTLPRSSFPCWWEEDVAITCFRWLGLWVLRFTW
jgi:hypothetical protein